MPKSNPERIIDRPYDTTLRRTTGVSGGGTSGTDLTALLRDGSRSLQGNLAVETGITIDGVDIGAHKALYDAHIIDPSAHHDPVTAGDGIDLTGQAVAVDVTDLIDTNYGLTENTNNIRVNLASDPGLEFSSGALRVKVGNGLELLAAGVAIDLAADPGLEFSSGDLQMGTPGTLTHATTNAKSSAAHTHAVTASANPGAAASLIKTATDGTVQLVTLASNVAFFSGFAGSGYRIDYGITESGKASAEFDNLTVRGRMRVYELLIQQIRATNGSVFVSSASKAERVTADTSWTVNGDQLTFNGANAEFDRSIYLINTRINDDDDDRDLYHGFLEGDIIRAQRFEMDSNGGFASVRQSNLFVGTIHSLWEYTACLVSGDVPVVSDDFVRLGNDHDTTRQGALYLTADDSNAPFMDIVDGITSHADWNTAGKIKVRVGKLTGITDSDFGGTLEGYGLYGNNVYLRGQIMVTGGNAATTTDLAGKIDTGGAAADVNSNTTTIDGGRITTNSIEADKIAVLSLDALAADMGTLNLDGVMTIDTSGGIWQGTGTFLAPTTGLKIWNIGDVGIIAGYNDGTAQWYADTDGILYAGGGEVYLSENGIRVARALSVSETNSYGFTAGATWVAGMYGYVSDRVAAGNTNELYMAAQDTSKPNAVRILAYNGTAHRGAWAGFGALSVDSGSAYADTIYEIPATTPTPSTIKHRATEHYFYEEDTTTLLASLTVSLFRAVAVYSATTASAANVNVDSSGYLRRSTSSRRYKQDIRPLPGRWTGELLDALQPVIYRPAEGTAGDRRDFAGLIAEDVEAAGGGLFVEYGEDGRPESVMYDRLTVSLIAAVRDLRARVCALEATCN